jgi:glyoxylase-like metal-dependent hydrolase (beta-lactamase superfamily II)
MAEDAPSPIEIRQMVVGAIETNCYAVICDGECMVIDPGASGKAIAERLSDVHVASIVATHGHGDHVSGVAALKAATAAPFSMAAPDVEMALHAGFGQFDGVPYDDDAPRPDVILSDGDEVHVGPAVFRVISCPGHTPGGITLVGEGLAFVGDTLFAGSAGRTDLEGGDADALARTLSRLKSELPPSTTILPGHGPSTTMAAELEGNPYLR